MMVIPLFKTNRMKKITNIAFSLALMLISLSALAQDFRVKTTLDTVATSGYYNIQLLPEVEALSESYDLGDIRIQDNKGENVAYFLYSENPVNTVSSFIDYKLKSNDVKDSLNIVIVDNTRRDAINHFSVLTDNADVVTNTTVRGSNNQAQWYIVKQSEWVMANRFDKNTQIIDIDIPEGNYQYYEIVLSNSQASPLNVRQVGRVTNASIYGKFTQIDTQKMDQTENVKEKCTFLSFPDMAFEYNIAKLVFSINNKTGYIRNTSIVNKDRNMSLSFVLATTQNNTILMYGFPFSKDTKIKIENGDDHPLHVDSVSIYVLNRYACAYLEAGQTYNLYTGNDSISKPNYDIEHLKKHLPTDLPIVKMKIDKIEKAKIPAAEVKREPSIFEKPIFLWSVIIIVGLFLIFICFKMISEVKKKK